MKKLTSERVERLAGWTNYNIRLNHKMGVGKEKEEKNTCTPLQYQSVNAPVSPQTTQADGIKNTIGDGGSTAL